MIEFYKYSALASDFVIVDNRSKVYCFSNQELVERICDQKIGIGGEGLVVIGIDKQQRIEVVLYNIDGNRRTLDLSAALCVGKFLLQHHRVEEFCADNHVFSVSMNQEDLVGVSLQQASVHTKERKFALVELLGLHHVSVVRDLDHYSVRSRATNILYDFEQQLETVSFVEQEGPEIFRIRTYKSALQEEVLSCASAAVAVALCMGAYNKTNADSIVIQTNVDQLRVALKKESAEFIGVAVQGKVDEVFKGTFYI